MIQIGHPANYTSLTDATLAEVKPILAAFRAAAEAGEFDPALRQAAERKAKVEVATTEQAHEQR